MDREVTVDGVGELQRGTHLFLVLLGWSSLRQPPEPAPQWGPAFLSVLASTSSFGYLCRAFTCTVVCYRQVNGGMILNASRKILSVRAFEWLSPRLGADPRSPVY